MTEEDGLLREAAASQVFLGHLVADDILSESLIQQRLS